MSDSILNKFIQFKDSTGNTALIFEVDNVNKKEKNNKIMEHKWNFEIIVNGELDYWNKFTVDEIKEIKNFIKNNIERNK